MGAELFDPYYQWLGIRPSEQPADYYRLLGIAPFEDHPAVIERAGDRQMSFIRRFQTKHPAETAQLLSQLSLARLTLLDPQKKLLYDQALRNTHAPEPPQPTAEGPGPMWYFQALGQIRGPFTTEQLQDRIKSREVRYDTVVRNGADGGWILARQAKGLFDLPLSSPPPPGTRLPQIRPLEPPLETTDLLSCPLPSPEDRTPGRNVWVCRGCRWPVPKGKIHCPRCGYIKKVSQAQFTEQGTAFILLLLVAGIVAFFLANIIVN